MGRLNIREHDACAVFAALIKNPAAPPDRPLWLTALEALGAMEHRSGQLDGQSDGTGLLVSVPTALWESRLQRRVPVEGESRPWFLSLVLSVGDERIAHDHVVRILEDWDGRVLGSHWDVVDGGDGIWTVAFVRGRTGPGGYDWRLLEAFEAQFPGSVAGLSQRVIPFKVRADASAAAQIAHKLWGDDFSPRVVLGHNRFSTNTTTELKRVQPFMALAHNGEINTIDRVRSELHGLGFDPIEDGSDSQTLDRALVQIASRWGFSLGETLRLLSPASPAVVRQWPEELQRSLAQLEWFWQPVAQGPQALLATDGRELVASVDAMGLRPLWILDTAEAVIVSSEAGVVDADLWTAEPRIIAPGELVSWTWAEDGSAVFRDAAAVVRDLHAKIPSGKAPMSFRMDAGLMGSDAADGGPGSADGWTKDDRHLVKFWTQSGQEPVSSLGHDAPLAALSGGIATIADYLQETVAVVTNPALDREREFEHFRLDSFIGARSHLPGHMPMGPAVRLDHPWLADGDLARLQEIFGPALALIPLRWESGRGEYDAALAVGNEAVGAVESGVSVLVLTDADRDDPPTLTLDPTLALAAVMRALSGRGMSRRACVVVRSGMIRNLHDAVVLLGLGARALIPWRIWHEAGDADVVEAMNHGLEKIISTMGTHWLHGYGRNFSAIGLPTVVAELLGISSWGAPQMEQWERLREEVRTRRIGAWEHAAQPPFLSHFNPHVYKTVQKLIGGELDTRQYHDEVRELEHRMPTQLRHVIRVVASPDARASAAASLSVGRHKMPFVISSMSFGSQGETAFRAYAEAARKLNIVAMNGEGGEILDMIGQYAPWRGYQIASGRFGVNADLLNGASYVEIKIGQGAKPGEGGHLPGRKVSEKVAQARRARPGVDLISPSNNHDLYSIEDLRQLIDELKTVNPKLSVVVKVPVVPNIGTIAVGIVKAGADVVTLSGFDGGTGAARAHALRHVGLPADVGVPLAHQALAAAGVRDRVELWADGGVRTADDALKLILMGADRIGFGTMAMVALGCTICRQCQRDTCHVGITTQIESVEEAHARGLKRFVPQEPVAAVDGLVRYFEAMAEELARNLGRLGFSSVGEAVGRWDLLKQWQAHERLDFVGWLAEVAGSEEEMALAAAMPGASAGHAAPFRSGGAAPVVLSRVDRRLVGVWQSGRRAAAARRDEEQVVVPGVAGQGFGAFLSEGLTCVAHGGAQDGVAKGASGGKIWILKHGQFGGHVGKSLAYGAQGGTVVVQGGADSRAGVRLAGARVVIVGDGLPTPNHAPHPWDSAAIKGFGFEYMTRGEAMVLTDPGPWIASGMTGGVIYLRHDPECGLTREFLQGRISQGAQVSLTEIGDMDVAPVTALLGAVSEALEFSGQTDRAGDLRQLAMDPCGHFLKIIPVAEQVDQQISTE